MPEPGHPSVYFRRLPKLRRETPRRETPRRETPRRETPRREIHTQTTLGGIDRRALRNLATRLGREVAGGRSFTCLITSDDDLRRMNREFLGHDCATDVLSFPSASPNGEMGDVAISLDRALEQAGERGHTVCDEIGVLMLHGVLHLMGMDHVRDRGRMRRAETKWRVALGLPAGLIERENGGRKS